MTNQSQPVEPDSARPDGTDADAPVTYTSLTGPADTADPETESAPAFLSGIRPSFWPDNFIL